MAIHVGIPIYGTQRPGASGPGLGMSSFSIVENSAQGTAIATLTPTNASNPGAVSIASQEVANLFQMNVDGVTLEVGSNTAALDYETRTGAAVTLQYTDDAGTHQFLRTIQITDAPAIVITTGGELDTALLRVGDTISGAWVAGTYPDYNGNTVSESSITYYVDDVSVASSYVLQTGDGVGQAEVVLSATGADDLTYYSGISGITDFTFTPTDLEWIVPAGGGSAPVLSNPVDAANGGTAATGSVDTDGTDGTLYWVVTLSATKPTAAQVKAGQNDSGAAAADSGSQAVSGSGTQTLSPAPSGLTSETTYFIHFMHENAATDQSSVATGDGFTTADVTAPTLSSPTDNANGQTAATASVSTDEGNGTLYWVVTTSATAPSAAQVKAGNDHTGSAAASSGSQSVPATGTQNLSPAPSGLTASTAYFTHFMHEDTATNQSTVSSADGFTTASAGGAITFVGAVGTGTTSSTATLDLTSLSDGSDTSAADGDFVVLIAGRANNGDQTVTMNTAGYTDHGHLFANDSNDTAVNLFSKFMTSTPDTSAVADVGATSSNGGAAVALVFRGVDPTTPLDGVAVVTATGTDGNLADAGAITPATAGAWICAFLAGANNNSASLATGPANMDYMRYASGGGSSRRLSVGGCYYDGWTSGSFDPDAWTGSDNEAGDSWAAFTIALRPA